MGNLSSHYISVDLVAIRNRLARSRHVVAVAVLKTCGSRRRRPFTPVFWRLARMSSAFSSVMVRLALECSKHDDC